MSTRSLSLALPLILVACGASDPATLITEGDIALEAGDRESAYEKYEAALEGLDASQEGYLQAKLGAIRAAARTAPERAKSDFEALVQEKGDEVGPKEYSRVITALCDGDSGFKAATALLKEAQAKFPDSKGIANLVTTVGDKAKAGGVDEAGLKELESLGYL